MSDRMSAMEIEKQEFPRKVRGYDPDNVRMYLRSVAEEVGRLNLENGQLREEIGQLKSRLTEHEAREKTLQETLVSAQGMAGDLKERSRAEADLLVREARLKSERMLQQTQDQLDRLEDEIGRCKLERDNFERQVRGTIEHHLSLLESRKQNRAEADNVRVLRSIGGTDAG
jgi:cell division initiation protein